GYFETLRIPVRRGRAFRETDGAEAGLVAVVSESFARKYYAHHEAVGGHLKTGGGVREIVGVVGDVQQHSGLGNFGPLSIEPTIYVPAAQLRDADFQLFAARTAQRRQLHFNAVDVTHATLPVALVMAARAALIRASVSGPPTWFAIASGKIN
ncbi:MAG: ABC transporter permease, partial [Bradyrhizobium sp.]|nr:ABC transporter permease [Bradyrhizobium sp.]